MAQKYSFYNDPSIKLISPADWDDKTSIKYELKSIIANALKLNPDEVELNQNNPEDGRGDYSCSIALAIAQKNNEKSIDVANKFLAQIQANELIEKVEVAGSGFLNFFINKERIASDFIDAKEIHKPLAGKKIMLEFAHPNPFKAFHIGHLRNIILGESLVRILEKIGADVIRTNYQGDVGMHIAKCLWAFKEVPESDYPQDVTERVQLIAKCYTKGAKAFDDPVIQEEIKEINKKIYTKEDETINKLWDLGKKWSLDKFHQIYEIVDSHFDREYMESETLPFIEAEMKKAIESGILTKSEGAIIFDGSKYGIETRVYQNSRGLPTYEGKQLGLVIPMEMKDFGKLDLLLFNVAVEQISFFKSTIKVIELMYPEFAGRQYHNAYEFVGLKSGKMSSRTGNVVLGEDIINEAIKRISKIVNEREAMKDDDKAETSQIVGVGAIKYSFLNISPTSYLAFDLEKSLSFEGNSGPYIQYTYTRANKIVKDSKIKLEEIKQDKNFITTNASDEEVKLIKKILQFQTVITDSAKHLSPNILTTYLFELSQQFNTYYKFNSILKAENDELIKFRVSLTANILKIISEGLRLLGIKVPSSM